MHVGSLDGVPGKVLDVTEARGAGAGPGRHAARPGVEAVAGDRAIFSERALRLARGRKSNAAESRELSEEERARLRDLEARDREVRAHEQAHRTAGGELVLGATAFEYETGPDGRPYAVSGEVRIDTSEVEGDPAATIDKAERIVRAALAPSNPSPQDRRVAAEARAMAERARAELARRTSEPDGETGLHPLDVVA